MICVHRFPLSKTRSIIMNGLRMMVQKLERAGIHGDLWINGSFLTEKINPEDVDIALRISKSSLFGATPTQGTLINWFGSRDTTIVAQTKRDFFCDSFVFCELSVEDPQYPGLDIRQYWIDGLGKSRRNDPKGIVELLIGGGCQ